MIRRRFYIVKDMPDVVGRIIPLKVITHQPPLILGAPIIKYSPTINPYAIAKIKILSNNSEFTILVPMSQIRNVVDDIYLNIKKSENNTKPQINFRIITPTIDSTISTDFDNMVEIIKMINTKYNNLTFTTNDGRNQPLSQLLKKLLLVYDKYDNYQPIDNY